MTHSDKLIFDLVDALTAQHETTARQPGNLFGAVARTTLAIQALRGHMERLEAYRHAFHDLAETPIGNRQEA